MDSLPLKQPMLACAEIPCLETQVNYPCFMSEGYKASNVKIIFTMEDGSKVEYKPSDEDLFTGYNDHIKGYEIEEDTQEE